MLIAYAPIIAIIFYAVLGIMITTAQHFKVAAGKKMTTTIGAR